MHKNVEYHVVPCKNDNPNVYHSLWELAAYLCGGGERCMSDRGMHPSENGCSVFKPCLISPDMNNYCNEECDRLTPFAEKRMAINIDHRYMQCEIPWDFVVDDINDAIEWNNILYVRIDLPELSRTSYIKKYSESMFVLYQRHECYSDKPNSFNYRFIGLFKTEEEMEEYVRKLDTKL